ncbi:T9SS type A sorting domain-containing protein [Xanthomarina sp. GH4-25]|uniref:T9SS type A sorting domain-containing protein n=1 Tax=Xanthomarina sp. GH4-25 TaxID=3349335 RepID=UPI003877E19C
MKTKLPFIFLLLPALFFAQAPINDFFGIPMSSYAIVESTPEIDQSASGGGLTWNFTNLTSTGTNLDIYTAPTAGELATYPGTTEVLSISADNKIYSKDISDVLSLTGIAAPDVDLNYINDNAYIGTFPLNFGYSNTDTVGGTFSSAFASGTFTGTVNATVDAYGTLNMNDVGEGTYSGNITRLKVVQNLTLSISSPFPINAPATQTSYYYYDNSNNNLVFRSNTIEVALAGINETVLESFLTNPLSTPNNVLVTNAFTVVPNPVGDVLNMQFNQNETIHSITLMDISGRQVLSVNDNITSISVSHLQIGMYLAKITTDKGVYTKKFLKK